MGATTVTILQRVMAVERNKTLNKCDKPRQEVTKYKYRYLVTVGSSGICTLLEYLFFGRLVVLIRDSCTYITVYLALR